ENEFAKLQAQQPQQLSEAKQDFIQRHWDIPHTKQMVDLANGAHQYITQAMGVPDDSEQYFELMRHVLEPPAYQPPPTADDMLKLSSAKYELKPSEYNRGVDRLAREKAAGNYK